MKTRSDLVFDTTEARSTTMMQRLVLVLQQSRSRRFAGTAIVASSSLLLLFSQFHAVCGLSGTVGQSSESSFLQNRRTSTIKSSSSRLYSNNNLFSSFFGDMASSIASGKSSTIINSKLDEKLTNIPGVPAWSEIRTDLLDLQTPEEQEFRNNLALGYGVGSPLHALRLYDPTNKEENVRVVFYRDSASWCEFKLQWISFSSLDILLINSHHSNHSP